jgi:hypothetical protein
VNNPWLARCAQAAKKRDKIQPNNYEKIIFLREIALGKKRQNATHKF